MTGLGVLRLAQGGLSVQPTVGQAAADDASALVDVLKQQYEVFADNQQTLVESYRRKLQDPGRQLAWLAEDAGTPCAAAVVTLLDVRRQRLVQVPDGSHVVGDAELEHLVVLASHRRRQLGRQLQQRVMADLAAAGVVRVVLDVRSDNPGAARFWAACGWLCLATELNRGGGSRLVFTHQPGG